MSNYCALTGRVVRDPELKYGSNGKANVRVTIAVKNKFKNRETGKYDAQFFDFMVFDKTAEYAATFGKGDLIEMSGELKKRSFVTKEGKNVSELQIIANNLERLSKSAASKEMEIEPEEEEQVAF